jgi:hypothetical protein
LSAFRTTQLSIDPKRYIIDLSTKINSIGETTLELDSHADTCVLGCDALIFLTMTDQLLLRVMTLPSALGLTQLLAELLLMMTL